MLSLLFVNGIVLRFLIFKKRCILEEKKAKMRIDGLADEEEMKVLECSDLHQCQIETTSSLTIVNVQKGSIQLYLRADPTVFKSHQSFKSSIRAVIQKILEVGQVDTSIEGTFYVQVTFGTGETRGTLSLHFIIKRIHIQQ